MLLSVRSVKSVVHISYSSHSSYSWFPSFIAALDGKQMRGKKSKGKKTPFERAACSFPRIHFSATVLFACLSRKVKDYAHGWHGGPTDKAAMRTRNHNPSFLSVGPLCHPWGHPTFPLQSSGLSFADGRTLRSNPWATESHSVPTIRTARQKCVLRITRHRDPRTSEERYRLARGHYHMPTERATRRFPLVEPAYLSAISRRPTRLVRCSRWKTAPRPALRSPRTPRRISCGRSSFACYHQGQSLNCFQSGQNSITALTRMIASSKGPIPIMPEPIMPRFYPRWRGGGKGAMPVPADCGMSGIPGTLKIYQTIESPRMKHG
jgi:hypothetical protein